MTIRVVRQWLAGLVSGEQEVMGAVTGGRALITVGIRRNCDASGETAMFFLPPAQDPSLWEGR